MRILFTILTHLFLIYYGETIYCQQSNTLICPEVSSGNMEIHGNNCFDVQTAFDECHLMYIRVNMHFFLDDNCENPQNPFFAQGFDSYSFIDDPYSCYLLAEDLINRANEDLENNQDQLGGENPFWGTVFNPAHCNPLRYVLTGVHLHCSSDAQSITNTELNSLNNLYGVDINTSINVFITDLALSSNPSAGGVAPFLGATYNVIQDDSEGLLNHEMGHDFSLLHPFDQNENLDDTPDIRYAWWDANCDGTQNAGDQFNKECWREYATYLDQTQYNENCIETVQQGCMQHPCCDWMYINNNVMANNAFQDCYTNGQILKLLNHINNNKCNMIEAIGDNICPPPSPVVDIHILDELRTEYCSYCLRLEASSNDTYYMLDFYEVVNGNELFHTSTSWLDGPAERYCIATKEEKDGNGVWFGGFEPNKNYKVVMTVENDCGDQKTSEYYFTTPSTNCNVVASPDIVISPIPAINNLNITYTLYNRSEIRIIASHSIYGKYAGNIEENYNKDAGNYTISENVTGWYQGINYVVIQINDKVYSSTVLKL